MNQLAQRVLRHLSQLALAAFWILLIFAPGRWAVAALALATFIPLWQQAWPVFAMYAKRMVRRMQAWANKRPIRRIGMLRLLVLPPWLAVPWLAACGFILLAFFGPIFSNKGPSDPWFGAAIRIALLIVVVDASRLAWRTLRWSWGNPLGKAVLAMAGAIVGSVVLNFGRHALSSLIGEDPAKVPASLALFSVLMLPKGWISALSTLDGLLAVPVAAVTIWMVAAGRTHRRRSRPGLHSLLL